MKHLLIGLLACGLACACDDAEGTAEADMGGGGEGGGGVVSVETYLFTSLQMTEPAAAAGLLNGALTTNLNNGSLIVLMQMEDWEGGMPILRGGAGQLVEGADTEDIADDVFAWLTEGTCAAEDGSETPCSVDINEKAGARDGDNFTLEGGEIAIYAKDLKLIIPIKDLSLTGTRTGITVSSELSGVITQADAQATRFQLTPDGPVQVLDNLLATVNVMPDTMFEGAPAYTFAGSFDGELITFSDQ